MNFPLPFPFTGHFLVVQLDRQQSGTITPPGESLLRKAGSKMQIQRGLKKDSVHTKFVLGAHPIIEHFIEKMRIRQMMSTYLRSDKRMRLDDDKTLTLLIHNILTTPIALYEMEDWLQPLDAEKLGLTPRESTLIQDDRMGRALDRFYNSRHQDVFFRLALRAIKLFALDCSQIHHDTTSITFSGKYPGWSVQELLTHGKNKDHRPDLKQLVLGLSVTADGAVPISHRVYSGNQTDDRLHPANHRALQKLLQRVDFIYVADCKLATKENLQKIAAWQGRFVSVMPRTWSEDETFRGKVKRKEIQWKHILSRKNNRKPDSKMDRYYVAKGDYTTSHGYRLHWLRSTQKAEQDAATRRRQIERALAELRSLQTKLNRYHLKTRKQISQRIKNLLKEARCETLIQFEIHATREYKHVYPKKGRPTKDTPKKVTWKQIFSISFGMDKDAVNDETKVDGVFPLITNLDPETHPAKKVLEIYKFQPFLEKRFSQLKTYHEIAPMYLKKDERVVAYLHMHVMALMVAALIERTLRHAMKRKKLASIAIYPESRPCPAPTLFDIVRLFRNVERYEVRAGEETLVFPAELTDTQKQVLELLEVPVAKYQ
jgi:transposase|tara:strand:- start:24 stop:1823 length:1800 start_codon:yes stop_codon:yes gene_type:complete